MEDVIIATVGDLNQQQLLIDLVSVVIVAAMAQIVFLWISKKTDRR